RSFPFNAIAVDFCQNKDRAGYRMTLRAGTIWLIAACTLPFVAGANVERSPHPQARPSVTALPPPTLTPPTRAATPIEGDEREATRALVAPTALASLAPASSQRPLARPSGLPASARRTAPA